jgi:hypothetical protein
MYRGLTGCSTILVGKLAVACKEVIRYGESEFTVEVADLFRLKLSTCFSEAVLVSLEEPTVRRLASCLPAGHTQTKCPVP